MRSRVHLPLLTVLALVAALLAPPATAADRRTTPRAAPLQLLVNGYGHGHGLSQWGAQRQAEAGRTVEQVLRFYYPGLGRGTTSGTIRVLITADTSTDVVVLDRPGLRVRSLGSGRTTRLDKPVAARRWRVVPAPGGRSKIAWRAASGPWRTVKTVPGEAELSAGGQPVTLVTPAGRRAYRGALRSTNGDTVNVVPLESYLRGVVPREVFTSWRPVALRAQAVAARTYAAFERNDRSRRYFHVDDTTSSQVYGGATDEVASTDAAIRATARQVLTSDGRPAFTQFSASNGGWTSAGSRPYLVAKQDPYDDTYRSVPHTVTPAEIQRALPSIGTFERLGTIRRDGNGQWGGRALSVQVVGSQRTVTISGDDFRSFFGLNSSWFRQR